MPRHRYAIAAVIAVLLPAGPLHAQTTTAPRPTDPEKIAAAHLKRFGKGYVARIDRERKIVYVSALDKKHFDDTVRLLADYTDAQRKTLLTARPPWHVTVILPTVDDYRKLTPSSKAVGFYHPLSRTLISIDRGNVLLHEFTHALHHADQAAARQAHPIWITEGLATLFESAEIAPGGLRPAVDARVVYVRYAVRTGSIAPFKWLLNCKPELFMKDTKLSYGMARYLMLYLHSKGLLRKWYALYKETYDKDPTGAVAMEKLFGRALVYTERDWKNWVLKLEIPYGVRRAHQGRLGIQMGKHPRGVKIVSMLPQGAAAQAGRLRVGDVVTVFNGHAVRNPAELGAGIRATGELKTVTIELIRNGQAVVIQQPLGAIVKPRQK